MVSTLVNPATAESLLKDADEVLDEMDPTKVQVRLLKDDNERMKADLRKDRDDVSEGGGQ